MTLQELSELTKSQIVLRNRTDPTLPRWYGGIEHAEAKDGDILSSTYGNGDTPSEALENHVAHLRGKLLILHSMGPDRAEFNVPESLVLSEPVATETPQG